MVEKSATDAFAKALTEIPKLAHAAGCYVAVKVYASKEECDRAEATRLGRRGPVRDTSNMVSAQKKRRAGEALNGAKP